MPSVMSGRATPSELTQAGLIGHSPEQLDLQIEDGWRSRGEQAFEAMVRNDSRLFIAKLEEAVLSESICVQLYDMLLERAMHHDGYRAELVATFRQIRDEELAHVWTLIEALERVGVRARTALAEHPRNWGIAAQRVAQVLAQPHNSMSQCLHAMLIYELGEQAAWETLVTLMAASGDDTWLRRFQAVLQDEQRHANTIKALLSRELPDEDGAAPSAT